ncbi:hypothetical protein CDD80_2147 [Ophiocordyceps camponoti-rufipedis]|uniref:Uncharacterized protein n=1 Tax=Ophiocordyceps camponoti-rufipedis TaxID=2004952 RepID=A0A2C5Z6V4_9HYPO|nr:hypothetical protein CDD80_2147 [Ophiocordyceps camponoti-rufipedis]
MSRPSVPAYRSKTHVYRQPRLAETVIPIGLVNEQGISSAARRGLLTLDPYLCAASSGLRSLLTADEAFQRSLLNLLLCTPLMAVFKPGGCTAATRLVASAHTIRTGQQVATRNTPSCQAGDTYVGQNPGRITPRRTRPPASPDLYETGRIYPSLSTMRNPLPSPLTPLTLRDASPLGSRLMPDTSPYRLRS